MRSMLALALLLGSTSMVHAAAPTKVSKSEWKKVGFDGKAQKAFAEDAQEKLSKAGIKSTIFPKAKDLGGKPYLGSIQIQVKGGAKNVKKAFKLLAPEGAEGSVNWRNNKNKPNVMSLMGDKGTVQFQVATKHGAADYNQNLNDD